MRQGKSLGTAVVIFNRSSDAKKGKRQEDWSGLLIIITLQLLRIGTERSSTASPWRSRWLVCQLRTVWERGKKSIYNLFSKIFLQILLLGMTVVQPRWGSAGGQGGKISPTSTLSPPSPGRGGGSWSATGWWPPWGSWRTQTKPLTWSDCFVFRFRNKTRENLVFLLFLAKNAQYVG